MSLEYFDRTRDVQSDNRASGFLLSAARLFSHIAWPLYCPVCGKLGVHICRHCLFGLLRDLPVIYIGGDAVCCGATRYDDINRSIVHAMKYRNAKGVARTMGEAMAWYFGAPEADCLVPVPLHMRSERDYNQAAEIAGGASEVWNIPVVEMLSWSAKTRRQALKGGARERELPEGAIIAKCGSAGALKAFLVDDVYTTGSTLRAAKAALEYAGSSVAGAMVWSVR